MTTAALNVSLLILIGGIAADGPSSEAEINRRLQQLGAEPTEIGPYFEIVKIGAPAVPTLISALESKNAHVRRFAIAALGVIADARAVPALIKVADRQDDSAKDALESLGEIGGPEAAKALLRHAAQHTGHTRLHLLVLVAKVGDPQVIEPLLAMIQSPEPGTRGIAADALSRFRDPRVRAVLARLANEDPDWRVCRTAKQGLDRLASRHRTDWVPWLEIAIVRRPDPPEGAEEHIRKLREQEAKAPPPPKDLTPAQLFAGGGTGGGIVELVHFVTERERNRAIQHICDYCRRNDTDCDDAIEQIMEFLCNIKENADVRQRARELLLKIGSPALRPMVNGLVRGDEVLRGHMEECLVKMNHPTAVRLIALHLKNVMDPAEKVRLQVVADKIQSRQPQP